MMSSGEYTYDEDRAATAGNDPVSEAAAALTTSTATATTAAAGGGRNNSRRNPLSACCQRILPEFLRDPYERQYFFLVVMTNPLWRILMCFCILLMLFGSPIQYLWSDPKFDGLFDVLYTVAFCVFCVDIALRILVVPGYVSFKYKSIVPKISIWKKNSRYSTAPEEDPEKWGKVHIGSFLFWCDVISTASLLYEITYINKSQKEIQTIDIQLDMFGIPSHGQVNRNIPVETEIYLLITIFKTIRVVRFVRSSRVAKLVGKVNWYWPFQVLNPYFWFRRRQNHGSGNPSSPNSPDGAISSSNGKKDGDDNKATGTNSDRINALGSGPPERSLGLKRKSWGGLGLATLAAVKAHNLAKEEQQKQEVTLWGKFRKFLWKIGLLRNDKVEWRRQLAATKIQRAWRKAKQYDDPQSDPADFAWQGSFRKSAKALRKHSIMKNYSSLNKNFRQFRNHRGVDGSTHTGDATTLGTARNNSADYYLDKSKRDRNESQVGSAMRDLTGQRVAFGIIVSLILTVLFTYSETNATRPVTMMVLHKQTSHEFKKFSELALDAARNSSVPDLYRYDFGDDREIKTFEIPGEDTTNLRNREILRVSVTDYLGRKTTGFFTYRSARQEEALMELLATLFVLLIWLFGVTAFAGPVMILVVLPIERMVRLLGMLMLDPLGYQSTSRYRKFVAEEDLLTKNTRWTKEVLKGMETSFLMSTILRIGSLMKVGFGSAGVEIIRKNLEKKQGGNVNLLTSQGTTVSCIFLFCDIRQFTDATECLQEEVFVFTNRIAAVVHSFCHSYGGSANKNIGDAFLCSWLLDDPSTATGSNSRPSKDGFCANNNQADKCLLCVVKVVMALHHDDYYVETMNETPKERLLAKLSKRPGPIVQMGFGLHAGKAVQGAIGSERKIDATYVSEAVEMAEFLESSTKKYGVNMLMSDVFHRLLHSSNRYRCRIVDQIVIQEDDADEDEIYDGDIIELYTYDINIDALWEVPAAAAEGPGTETISDTESFNDRLGSRREVIKNNLSLRGNKDSLKGDRRRKIGRRMSLTRLGGKSQTDVHGASSEELKLGDTSGAFNLGASAIQSSAGIGMDGKLAEATFQKPELVLPTGPALYNANIWRSEQMLKIRAKYSDGLFFHKFNSGLQSFYAQDWDHAKQCFQGILDDCLDDGPSKYFLDQIKKYNGKPPPNFRGYGIA